MANTERLIQIFDQASARSPGAERDGFLAEACQGDPDLKEQVLSLLESDAVADGFLARPIFSPTGQITEQLGDVIGRYKLLEKVGEGGCGVVYAAEQTQPVRRRVAVKVIKLGMDTKQVIARFEAERQALARMDHANIAKVLDAGSTETGRPYFVMELVQGVRITEFCDQNQLSTRERLDLFIKVCHAIQHAHQKGVIHRDIKPSNILVSLHDGVPVPKVIDFGVAKATEGRLTEATVYTQQLHFIGTPAYMSPEQAELSGLDVDTRSDIYSLGVLLYELLTGQTPFDGQEMIASGFDAMRKTIREQEPVRPSTQLARDCPRADVMRLRPSGRAGAPALGTSRELINILRGDLDWIVMKCLEKNRSRRYETANGLAADLKRHLNNEPVAARPPSTAYRLQKAFRRNKLIVAASGAVGLAMLLALIVLAVSIARISKEKNLKDLALRDKQTALNALQVSAGAAKEQLFQALLSQARASRFSGQMGQRLGSHEALTKAAQIRSDERLRDEAIAAMALPDLRLGPDWPMEPLSAVDGSYRLSAHSDAHGVLTVRTVLDRRVMARIESGHHARLLSLSEDGRYVAQLDERTKTDDRRTLRVWRVADAQAILSESPEMCSDFVFSHDSQHLCVGQEDRILRFDLQTGRELNHWPVKGHVHSLAFHQDNRQIAVGYEEPEITSVYDANEGRHLADLPVDSVEQQVVAWHPDGRRLAISGEDPRIQIWDVPTKTRLATLEGHVQRVTSLSFHPDGELLASQGWEGGFRLWHPSSGRQLMKFPRALWPFGFSTDGQWLGGVGNGAGGQLVQIATCPEYRTYVSTLGAGHGEYQSGDISSDGRLLALAMGDGVRLWNLANGSELAFLPLGHSYSAIFQPDGRELLTCGLSGLYRWPIVKRDADSSATLQVGPPVKIPLPFLPARADRSRDGRTLAVVSEQGGGALIVDLTTGLVQGLLKPHRSASYVALSPDGQWLATAGWHSDKTQLWNLKSGEMAREWIRPADSGGRVSFTPDSRALILSQIEEFVFCDLESYLERHFPCEIAQYPNEVVFSPEGALMAMEMAPGMIHLKAVQTGRVVARLEDPQGDRTTWMMFTPDGAQLITASNYDQRIHLWDLRAIRARLKTMGLDWAWPEFPPRVDPVRGSRYPKNPLTIDVKAPKSGSSPSF